MPVGEKSPPNPGKGTRVALDWPRLRTKGPTMRTLLERWRSMDDSEIQKISEAIIGIHWLIMGFVIIGLTLLPFILGISPEVLASRIW